MTGQGLLVLLSGQPGTGKTLMAEASKLMCVSTFDWLTRDLVADKIGYPLYYINAQDLGEGPATVSTNLTRIMDNAAEWNALVLLDGLLHTKLRLPYSKIF